MPIYHLCVESTKNITCVGHGYSSLREALEGAVRANETRGKNGDTRKPISHIKRFASVRTRQGTVVCSVDENGHRIKDEDDEE